MQDQAPPPGSRVLTWIAAVVGIGVVAGLVFVATQIIGSATSRQAWDEAEQNPPPDGTYALAADPDLVARPGLDLRVEVTGLRIADDQAVVELRWTNEGQDEIAWECGVLGDAGTSWYAISEEIDAYPSAETTPDRCRNRLDATAAPVLDPGTTRVEQHTFALDGSWGAGPVRVASETVRSELNPVEFTLDLDAATRS